MFVGFEWIFVETGLTETREAARKPLVVIIHMFAMFFEVQLQGHGALKTNRTNQEARGKNQVTKALPFPRACGSKMWCV